MKIITYIAYLIWVLCAVTFGIMTKNYLLVLSPILLPLAIGISIFVVSYGLTDILALWKRKEESKVQDSCDICLFNETAKHTTEQKCLGCVMDESHKWGELCPYYTRHLKDNSTNSF